MLIGAEWPVNGGEAGLMSLDQAIASFQPRPWVPRQTRLPMR